MMVRACASFVSYIYDMPWDDLDGPYWQVFLLILVLVFFENPSVNKHHTVFFDLSDGQTWSRSRFKVTLHSFRNQIFWGPLKIKRVLAPPLILHIVFNVKRSFVLVKLLELKIDALAFVFNVKRLKLFEMITDK